MKIVKLLLFFAAFFVLSSLSVLAYDVNIRVNSNIGDFNTYVYKCVDPSCEPINYYTESHTGTTRNDYRLVGTAAESNKDYYMEYNYLDCYWPNILRLSIWGPVVGTYGHTVDLENRNCRAVINSAGLSGNDIEIDESVKITANVQSAFDYPFSVPETAAIPDNIKTHYSSDTRVTFYANGVEIGQIEDEILISSDKDFSFEWIPGAEGTYDITVKTEVIDCSCDLSNSMEQTLFAGTVEVVNPDKDGDGYKVPEDCDDNDPYVNPGAEEICDGIDNDCDDAVDESDDSIDEPLSQACGSGNCQGNRVCIAAWQWSDCDTEGIDVGICIICDADGNEAYDETQDSDCDDGFYCNGEEECLGIGSCTDPDDIDCSYLDDQCNQGVCNDNDGVDNCETQPINEGVDCDDDLFCNTGETCQAGICGGGQEMDCDDGKFCTVNERCDEATDSCISDARDCSLNDLPEIATCFNDPDNNPFTWDSLDAFTSICDEDADHCTTSIASIDHTCNFDDCEAECDDDNPCSATDCDHLDGCVDDDYHDYADASNDCLSSCECEQNSCAIPVISYNDARCTECQKDDDCNSLDRDYCSFDIRMHDEGRCVNYICETETSEAEDCDQKNGIMDDCGVMEWTCIEEDSEALCVIDNIDADDSLCPDTCDGSIRVDSYCNPVTYNCDSITEECNNGLFCDGIETCSGAQCMAGAKPDCNDNIACTDDTCNEATDSCDNTADDANCDDGVGCTDDTCDSVKDCQFTPSDANCNDNVGCTKDTCDAIDDCQFAINDSYCDNGLFCDGIETCDAITNCQPGTQVDCSDNEFCTVNERCDEATDSCISDARGCSGNDIEKIATCFNDP
ncbi:hypothetical protein KY358_05425, partial [Candidatus Woesearchaeota archaeon]|nr:hypothetical protein [Candidatus Woesearchaeota archaeon]